MTQVELARRAGVGRHAVQYWEAKPIVKTREHAPSRFCEVLGLPDYWHINARAGGWGSTRFHEMQAERQAVLDAQIEAQMALWREREAQRQVRRRVVCAAQTRKGNPCRLKSEPGRRRCKFHGGKSTGPKTTDGRARIAEAQRQRWARWRAERDGGDVGKC